MSRGGARPGAGRKAPRGKRVTVTARVLPETKETIREMRAAGISIGDVLDKEAFLWKLKKGIVPCVAQASKTRAV